MNVRPGWYDDPDGRNQIRYWDGVYWTSHVTPKPGSPEQRRFEADAKAALVCLLLGGLMGLGGYMYRGLISGPGHAPIGLGATIIGGILAVIALVLSWRGLRKSKRLGTSETGPVVLLIASVLVVIAVVAWLMSWPLVFAGP